MKIVLEGALVKRINRRLARDGKRVRTGRGGCIMVDAAGAVVGKILTAALFCLMATAAHAGEPWPANVCSELASYEHMDGQVSKREPTKRAYARENVLHMLRDHCGWDISKKEAVDMAAVGAPSYSDDSSGGGGWTAPIEPIDGPRRSNPTHCTTMSLGGGLSSTDCE